MAVVDASGADVIKASRVWLRHHITALLFCSVPNFRLQHIRAPVSARHSSLPLTKCKTSGRNSWKSFCCAYAMYSFEALVTLFLFFFPSGWGTELKTRDWKTRHQTTGLENARKAWKAKWCTSHVVFIFNPNPCWRCLYFRYNRDSMFMSSYLWWPVSLNPLLKVISLLNQKRYSEF